MPLPRPRTIKLPLSVASVHSRAQCARGHERDGLPVNGYFAYSNVAPSTTEPPLYRRLTFDFLRGTAAYRCTRRLYRRQLYVHVKKILDDIWKEWRMRGVARKMKKKKKKILKEIREREREREIRRMILDRYCKNLYRYLNIESYSASVFA